MARQSYLVAMRRETRDLFNILASLEPVLREKENKEDKDISDVIQRLNQPLDNCMETLKALETLIQKNVKAHKRIEKVKMADVCVNFQREGIEGSNRSACQR
jgi:hypothetical protein